MKEREISSALLPHDIQDFALRPQSLSDFTGQKEICSNLTIFIESAKARSEVLDHVLLAGPPGLGKTTLAQIIARELGVNFKTSSGPVLNKTGDLAALLTNLEANDVLFIDEIHRINKNVEEVLYSAMEDYFIDIIIGEGPGARSVRLDIAPFTLIGATTRTGLLTNPLRDRFGIPLRLNFYTHDELKLIIARASSLLKVSITPDGIDSISACARGTPRVAGRLLRRVRDFAIIENENVINKELAVRSLSALGVEKYGLDELDRRYLNIIAKNFQGGPVGVETLSAALNEARDAIEEVIEPYLIKLGFVNRSTRGRILTQEAFAYLGITLEDETQG